jgi:hypothetical protein
MIIFLLSFLCCIIAIITWNCYCVFFAELPNQVKTIVVGTRPQTTITPIPKVIWSYWQQAPVPALILQCHANWKRFAPDYEIHILSKDSLSQWIYPESFIDEFDALPAFRQADWIRLQLLKHHGGVWIDASTILTQNLNWVQQHQQESQSEYVGFYIEGLSNRPDQPMLENWFMACVPNSQFIADLAMEFDHALSLGGVKYLEQLAAQEKLERVVQKLNTSTQRYLLMHVAASVLMDRNLASYRLLLARAEDSALGFHQSLNWRKRQLYIKLALLPCPQKLPMLIKLRGNDRRIFEQYLARYGCNPNSFLANYLTQ